VDTIEPHLDATGVAGGADESPSGDAPTPPTIRRVSRAEAATTVEPLQAYAFGTTPTVPTSDEPAAPAEEEDDKVRLVAFDGAEPSAVVVGIPMRQNVRGVILPMMGVSGVATHPAARRRGHIRTLLTQLHETMRDAGHVVSTLYPFRPSFYERFGYVGFPMPRRIRLFPDGLDRLLRADAIPGEVTLHRIGEALDEFRQALEHLLLERHGFSLYSPEAMARYRSKDDRWVALARHDGEVVGVLLYRSHGLGKDFEGHQLLTRGPLGRMLLLRWLARHHDQHAAFTLELPPDERPDLWYVDIRYTDETKVAGPLHSAPMGRVLSVPGLAGLRVGAARATVEVVDDPFVAGTWTFDGSTGSLEVRSGGTPTATLTSHGLAALVYGVLDPTEIHLRGYGTMDAATAQTLRTLFPAATPYLYASF